MEVIDWKYMMEGQAERAHDCLCVNSRDAVSSTDLPDCRSSSNVLHLLL